MTELLKINNLFKIFYEDGLKNSIGIENTSDSELRVFFIDKNNNFNLYDSSFLKPFNWIKCFVDNVDLVNIYVSIKDTFYVYEFSVKSKSFYKINEYNEFDFNLPITFIVGNMGGGTSIVAKLLRYKGIHLGDDCGEIHIRKPHESMSFKMSVRPLIDDINTSSDIRNNINQIFNLYNYKKDKINCVKLPNLSLVSIKICNIFTNCKFISVQKRQNNFTSTIEGNEFNKKHEIQVLKQQRPLLEGNPIFHLNFDLFFTEYDYTNKVLKFLGSDDLIKSETEFNELKNKIQFNSKVLQ